MTREKPRVKIIPGDGPFKRAWVLEGKTYDTTLSEVIATKVFDKFDPYIDDMTLFVETLYRTAAGDYFTHGVEFKTNGDIEHHMFPRTAEIAETWKRTLDLYERKN